MVFVKGIAVGRAWVVCCYNKHNFDTVRGMNNGSDNNHGRIKAREATLGVKCVLI